MEHKYKKKYKPLELQDLEQQNYAVVRCPKCNEAASSSEININDKIAKCNDCNIVFSWEKDMVALKKEELSEEIKRPEGIDLLVFENELELGLTQPYAPIFALVITLAPLLIFIFLALFFKKDAAWALYPGVGFLSMFIYALYKLIRRKENKVYITVNSDKLEVQWRPQNFNEDKIYKTDSIEQLYVKTDSMGLSLYMIINGIDGQKHQRLLSGFTNVIKAKYVEQEIERFLNIKNKKVSGELS